MKGPKFNARLTKANQESDIALARILATYGPSLPPTKLTFLKEVLRPYVHTLNLVQEEGCEPIEVHEAITALTASMFIEFMHRSVAVGATPEKVTKIVNDFMADVLNDVVMAVNALYGPGTAAPPPAADVPDTVQ